MIKQDYLIRMILEIITLIATALLNKQKIRPQSWVEYDCLTRQILEVPSDQLKDMSPEEIIDKYEGDTNRMGKIELAAMTLLKISDELDTNNLLLKYRLKQNGTELLKFVQSQGDTFSLQRMSLINMLDVDMADNYLSVEDRVEHTSSATTPLFITGNSYIARIVGKDNSGIATYAFASLSEIGRIFNPVYAQYFQSGDWSSLKIGDLIQAILCDPGQYLVAAYYSPLDGSEYAGHGVSEEVNVGFFPSGVLGFRITNPVIENTIALNKPASIYTDFRGSDAAFSQYIIYLPGVGSVNLSPDIMEGSLSLKYHVDLLTGTIFYLLMSSASGLVGTYSGNIYASLQTAKGDASGGSSFITSAAGAAASFVAGDVVGTGAKAIEAVKSAVVPTPSINGSQAGIAALRSNPDVIISVLQKSSGEFPVNQLGRPCCKNLTIGNLSGFVKCGAPSIALPMESAITDEVNAYLANGFYFE